MQVILVAEVTNVINTHTCIDTDSTHCKNDFASHFSKLTSIYYDVYFAAGVLAVPLNVIQLGPALKNSSKV